MLWGQLSFWWRPPAGVVQWHRVTPVKRFHILPDNGACVQGEASTLRACIRSKWKDIFFFFGKRSEPQSLGRATERISPEGCQKSGTPSATYPTGNWAAAPAIEVKRIPWGAQKQTAARSEAPAPLEALAKDSRAKKHDAWKARGHMPPAAIGTTPPTPHTRLTSTRAPWPHGTPQEQPAAQPEALAHSRPSQKTAEEIA